MQELLNELKNIKGVIGVLISNMKGNIAASYGEFGTISLKSIASEIINSAELQNPGNKQPEWLQFTYNTMSVLVKIQSNVFVLILCQPDAMIALIRLTLNVTMSKIKKDKKILRSIIKA